MSSLNFSYTRRLIASLRMFKRAYGEYKIQIIIMVILGFFGGLVGALGIGIIIPLFALVLNTQADQPNKITDIFEHVLSYVHLPMNIPIILGVMIGLFVAKALIMYIAGMISTNIASGYEANMRTRILEKTLATRWPYLLNQRGGYLEQLILTDASTASTALTTTSDIVIRTSSLITYAIVAFNISAPVTLITLAIGGLGFFILKRLFYTTRKLAQQLSNLNKTTAHHISQIMAGIKTIKAYAAERAAAHQGEKYFEEYKGARNISANYERIMTFAFEPVSIILVSGLFLFSYRSPTFNVASFAVVIYLVQKIFASIQQVQSRLHSINVYVPSISTLIKHNNASIVNREERVGARKFILKKEIAFNNIWFSYPEQKDILTGVSFNIPRGQMIGLIGHSGSGKTTLADLLLRLFEPEKGTITVDGMDIHEINLKTWRRRVGYVSQDVFLLNDTVENNIRFFNSKITPENIERAAKLAHVYDFVKSLPEGFKTIIGERGVKLSGGQRQRIALARALAHQPQILLLDEATSALDNESELAIQKAIEGLRGQITILVIAHRLSTIVNTDNVIVLDRGKIIEQGSPEKLLKDPSTYFHKMHSLNNVKH